MAHSSFDSLLETTLGYLRPAATPLPLPAAYARAEAGPPHATVTCLTRHYALAGKAELRSVLMTSPRVQIVNLFAYPAPALSLPIFALEFVQFGTKPIVGVIDLASPATDPACTVRARQALEDSHARYPDLVNADDPPAWFSECRSGHDFFVRPPATDTFARLTDVHFRLWAQWVNWLDNPPLEPASADTAARIHWLRGYKDHHRAHSPGLPFLHKTFGVEWTDTLLKNHFFA